MGRARGAGRHVPALTAPASPIVEIRGLTVRWPRPSGAGSGPGGAAHDSDEARSALDDIDLTVGAGEIVGLLGPTGSGRTTLLRCCSGIVPQLVPAEVVGWIRVGGLDPLTTPVAEMARRVAVVLDDPEAQLSQATAADEVAFGLENLAIPAAEMRARVAASLDAVGLDGFGDRDPLTLSGGEQQRLASAAAVAMRPALLVLDEPLATLDPRSARGVLDLVRGLARERRIAVLIAEHDVERLAEVADRLAVLEAGRVVADGPVRAVLSGLAGRGMGPLPAVTELAARIGPPGLTVAGGPGATLPVTVDEAVTWLAPAGRP